MYAFLLRAYEIEEQTLSTSQADTFAIQIYDPGSHKSVLHNGIVFYSLYKFITTIKVSLK